MSSNNKTKKKSAHVLKITDTQFILRSHHEYTIKLSHFLLFIVYFLFDLLSFRSLLLCEACLTYVSVGKWLHFR